MYTALFYFCLILFRFLPILLQEKRVEGSCFQAEEPAQKSHQETIHHQRTESCQGGDPGNVGYYLDY